MNLEIIRKDFQILYAFLFENDEPNLIQFSKHLKDFSNKHFRNIIERMDIESPKTDVEAEASRVIKKTKEQIIDEVLDRFSKSKMKKKSSFNSKIIIKNETVDECLSSIKSLDSQIKNYDHKALRSYFILGQTIIKLKFLEKKNFINLIKNYGLIYSKQHIYSIIQFTTLAQDYPKLLEYSVSFHFINQHIKTIRELLIMKNLNL